LKSQPGTPTPDIKSNDNKEESVAPGSPVPLIDEQT